MARGYTNAKLAGTWSPLKGLFLKQPVTDDQVAPVWDITQSTASLNVRVNNYADINTQLTSRVKIPKPLIAPAPKFSPVIGAFGVNVVYLDAWTRTLTSTSKIFLAGLSTLSYQTNKGTEAGWGQIPEAGEDLNLEWSADGITWTGLSSSKASTAPADVWVTQTVTIPDAAKVAGGVYLRFKQTGSSGNYANVDTWAFTNINQTFSGTQSSWVPVKTAWKKSSTGVWEQVYPTPRVVVGLTPEVLDISTIDTFSSPTQTVTIANKGEATLTILSATTSTNSNYQIVPDYTGLSGTNSDPACTIAPGTSRTFSVSIFGLTPGVKDGYITFVTNTGPFGTGGIVVKINGESLPRKPRAVVSVSGGAYANYFTGTNFLYNSGITSGNLPLTIKNVGELDLVVTSIDGGTSWNNTFFPPHVTTVTIAPNATSSFNAVYRPFNVGRTAVASITIYSNSDTGPITIPTNITEIHHGTDNLAGPRGTWTVPPGIYSITVTMLGGGGGGGGARGDEEPLYLGAGGGGGATVVKSFVVQPGQAFNYTIGAGGGGGSDAGGNGGTGGSSVFGTYSASGGAGGAGGAIYWGQSDTTGGGPGGSPNGGAGGGYDEDGEYGSGGGSGGGGSISVTY
jgi:hypothetical protein